MGGGGIIFTKFYYLKFLDRYKYVIHLDDDIVVLKSIKQFLTGDFEIAGTVASNDDKVKSLKYINDFISSNKGKYQEVLNNFVIQPKLTGGVIIYSDLMDKISIYHDVLISSLNFYINKNIFITEELCFLIANTICQIKVKNFTDLNVSSIKSNSSSFVSHCAGHNKFWNNPLVLESCPTWYYLFNVWKGIGGRFDRKIVTISEKEAFIPALNIRKKVCPLYWQKIYFNFYKFYPQYLSIDTNIDLYKQELLFNFYGIKNDKLSFVIFISDFISNPKIHFIVRTYEKNNLHIKDYFEKIAFKYNISYIDKNKYFYVERTIRSEQFSLRELLSFFDITNEFYEFYLGLS